MKNLFLLALFSAAFVQCTHSAKEQLAQQPVKTETAKAKLPAETITDEFGDKLEIYRNENGKKMMVKLNGTTYDLKKDFESTGFSTSDNVFSFTETKHEATFMKKNIGMVLFHAKKNAAENKMAAQ